MYAQKKYSLKIISNDSSADKNFKMPNYQNKFDVTADRKKELQKVLLSLYSEAYLAATFDSLVADSVSMKAYLNHGQQYQWASLRKGNVDEGILSQLGFSERIYRKSPFCYKDVYKLMDKLLVFYEEHGYPFAQVRLDSVNMQGSKISASLFLERKQLEKIDSVEVKGDLKLSKQYLYGYLGIKPGDYYDEIKVKAISTRIRALSFVSEIRPLQVIFVKDKVRIYLFLAKKSANQFNGIIGILPNPTGAITITGDVSLALQNSFHHAEEISFHWQHIQANTENLMTHLSYPYLLSTPLGFDNDFTLFKQDTTYLQTDEKVGLKYMLIGGNYWKVFYENITSTLIATTQLKLQTSGLPSYADNTTQLYGIEYKYEALDYIYNPRKGFEILVNAAAGTKQIHQNPNLNPQIYEGLQLNSNEYRARLDASYYFPIMDRSTIKLGVKGGYINAPSLMLNDLFRIGGFSTLRGFDEQSIYASQYSVGTVEYHYLLEQNSFLFAFYDQGYYFEPLIEGGTVHDTPFGFGVGMDFQTKAGIFSLAYAVGKEFNNPIDFKDGKISFGLINNF